MAQAPAAPSIAAADLVLKNGKIITVDSAFTIAQAIAIVGDRILAVGPDAAMAPHTGPATRVIDLKGKTVIPGITDGHAHLDREALRNVFPSLGRVRSIGDIKDRIAELARGKRPGEWIVTMPIGDPPYYFDVPDILAEKRWPTRHDLDAAAPNNPVYIRAIWGFWRGTMPLVSCANTEALRRADITRDTVSPVETLTIEKDASGEPTGIFIEQELQPIAELIWFRAATMFSHADRMRALPESARLYHSFGTTSVFEGHGAATELLQVYKQTHRAGALTMRSTVWPLGTITTSRSHSTSTGSTGVYQSRGCSSIGTPSSVNDTSSVTHAGRGPSSSVVSPLDWCANATTSSPGTGFGGSGGFGGAGGGAPGTRAGGAATSVVCGRTVGFTCSAATPRHATLTSFNLSKPCTTTNTLPSPPRATSSWSSQVSMLTFAAASRMRCSTAT